jgi:hypothetical protein
MIEEMVEQLSDKGISVYITGLTESVKRKLIKTKFANEHGLNKKLFEKTSHALSYIYSK